MLRGLGEAFDEKVLSIGKIIRSLEIEIGSISTEVVTCPPKRTMAAGPPKAGQLD